MRRNLLAGLLILLAAQGAWAQGYLERLKSPMFPLTELVQHTAVPAGSQTTLSIDMEVEEPWHVQANPATKENLQPTTLELDLPEGVSVVGGVRYPSSERLSFGDDQVLDVYVGRMVLGVDIQIADTVPPGEIEIPATLVYQACDDSGRCKMTRSRAVSFTLNVIAAGGAGSVTDDFPAEALAVGAVAGPGPEAPSTGGPAATSTASAGAVDVGAYIQDKGWLLTLGLIFLVGLALNLTPCVLPMIPVTIGYFGMQSEGSVGKRFALASSYVLGMVVMYAGLGVAAGMLGTAFGSFTTSPWFYVGEALIVGALALSMFGLYELRMPAALTQHATARSGYIGAAMMGLLVGVVAAPCSGPVVIGLVSLVAATKNPVLGMGLFSVLGLGLGLPFLALGMFSGLSNALPRSGAWTEMTKRIFGVIMLYAALTFLVTGGVIPDGPAGALKSGFWIAAGMYLIFGDAELHSQLNLKRLKLALGLAGTIFGFYGLYGIGLSGGVEKVVWPLVSEAGLTQALADGKPVVLDFGTKSCAKCDELEEFTFTDAQVQTELKDIVHLKVQADDGREITQSLLTKYTVQGFPTLVFLDGNGQEITSLRLLDYEKAPQFVSRIQQLKDRARSASAG